jgi:diguanylate cyclase (GGDEF)-like protein/PAS domain S-box-containing protein
MGILKSLRTAKGAAGAGPSARASYSDPDRVLALAAEYESSGQGWFWETDAEGRVTYLSPQVAELFGKSPEQLRSMSFHTLFITDQGGDGASPRNLNLLFGGRKRFNGLVARAALDTSEIYWTLSGRPVFDDDSRFMGYRGHGGDVTESQKAENETSRLAQFDSLTGLSNRHRMQQKIDATLTAFRAAKRCCAIMMIDLDRFKQVNDTFGHKAGDELLKQVAARLKRVFDMTCEVGRLGGDEFQVMLPDMDDRGQLGELAKKAIAMVSQPYSLDEGRCMIGASIGVAIAPYDGLTREEVGHSADIALYAAKNGGRGQFRFYSSELQTESHLRKSLEKDLRDALERGELTLEYQPVVSVKNNRIVALEALCRWYHPERGKIPPSIFIPIAEESNLINSIGEWVLRTACQDAARWPDHVRVSINLSEQQVVTEGFKHLVANALANAEISPERLEFELKESIHFGDGEATERELTALRKLGVRLALDDFGTGTSSLGYLRQAPFETLKIDPSFLRGAMDKGSRNVDLIGAIVALANALGMQTVAEGVEAMDELKLVTDKGVSHIQGFVYSPPMPADEVDEFLSAQGWEIKPNGPERQRSERRKVFRKVHIIHEDHFYDVVLRDLSKTGAMIEGLVDVPIGTEFVVDFGEGQLAVARVRRSHDDQQGLEFESSLVDDGAGGLCTRQRISPYALAAAGMPLAMLPPGQYPLAQRGPAGGPAGGIEMVNMPRFGHSNIRAKLAGYS